MDEYYAKYAGNNTGNGASDTDFESPEPDTTSSNNVKFLEEQQASKILMLYIHSPSKCLVPFGLYGVKLP